MLEKRRIYILSFLLGEKHQRGYKRKKKRGQAREKHKREIQSVKKREREREAESDELGEGVTRVAKGKKSRREEMRRE